MWRLIFIVVCALFTDIGESKFFKTQQVTGSQPSNLYTFSQEIEVHYYFEKVTNDSPWINFQIKDNNETVAIFTLNEKRGQTPDSVDVKNGKLGYELGACELQKGNILSHAPRKVRFVYGDEFLNMVIKHPGLRRKEEICSINHSHTDPRNLTLQMEIAQASGDVIMTYFSCQAEDNQNGYFIALVNVSCLLLFLSFVLIATILRLSSVTNKSSPKVDEAIYDEFDEKLWDSVRKNLQEQR
ncbi:uncharacterized protein LOC143027152 isoform X2 [Oratosquilla oratoria]|uniref:uncharacterized protein LOC143027152 isoform X2 n=1 Tax=Oratosquilla oratoria TaxID=337810 RepID=UPI003F76D538